MKKKILNALFICLIVIFSMVTVFSIVSNVCFKNNVVVVGTSMDPTLKEGDITYITKIKYVKNITYSDIIVYEHNDKDVIKRVIGLPGDHVQINNVGRIYINDNPLDETSYLGEEYVFETYTSGLKIYFDVTLKENEYYTLGDNRGVSLDCRTYGPIEYSSIKGKLKCVYAHGDYDASTDKVTNKKPITWRFY